MTRESRYNFVAAIYLNSRGFAFVVFEGELAPVDWGVVEARGSAKREKILARVKQLLLRCKPHVLVLQKMLSTDVHRPERIRSLNEAIAEEAQRNNMPVVFFSRDEIRRNFGYLGCVTKEAIASAIAKHIPAFIRYLPRSRKPWESEDARMGIFDAAALALTFYHAAPSQGASPPETDERQPDLLSLE